MTIGEEPIGPFLRGQNRNNLPPYVTLAAETGKQRQKEGPTKYPARLHEGRLPLSVAECHLPSDGAVFATEVRRLATWHSDS